MSNSDGNRESLPMPTHTPSTHTSSTDSAPPTWTTTRRPPHSLGTVNLVRYSPVGLSSGTSGGRPGKGICTFVYCGRSKPWVVQLPGTSIVVQPEPPPPAVQPSGASA